MTEHVLHFLSSLVGEWVGSGTNHSNEQFNGQLKLMPVVHGLGYNLLFEATGLDGSQYHQEFTLIAIDGTGLLKLWTLNSNVPGVLEHELRFDGAFEGSTRTLAFVHCEIEEDGMFREEIAIDLWPDGQLGYRYAWGMPGGDYGHRSGLRMVKK